MGTMGDAIKELHQEYELSDEILQASDDVPVLGGMGP